MTTQRSGQIQNSGIETSAVELLSKIFTPVLNNVTRVDMKEFKISGVDVDKFSNISRIMFITNNNEMISPDAKVENVNEGLITTSNQSCRFANPQHNFSFMRIDVANTDYTVDDLIIGPNCCLSYDILFYH